MSSYKLLSGAAGEYGYYGRLREGSGLISSDSTAIAFSLTAPSGLTTEYNPMSDYGSYLYIPARPIAVEYLNFGIASIGSIVENPAKQYSNVKEFIMPKKLGMMNVNEAGIANTRSVSATATDFTIARRDARPIFLDAAPGELVECKITSEPLSSTG